MRRKYPNSKTLMGLTPACATASGLKKERVAVGDVIYVEAATGQVRRVGRSEEFAGEFDLETDKFVPIPKGDVHKKKEVIQVPAFFSCHVTV